MAVNAIATYICRASLRKINNPFNKNFIQGVFKNEKSFNIDFTNCILLLIVKISKSK